MKRAILFAAAIMTAGTMALAAPTEAKAASGKWGNCIVITLPCKPGAGIPEVEKPGTDTPETGAPGTDTPETGAPGTDTPETEAPGTDTPETEAPGTGTLDTEKPEVGTPEIGTPENGAETEQEYSAYVLRIVELVNEERAAAGLKPLTLKADLTAAAQVRATECETLFSHTRPDGTKFTTALKEQGVSYRGAGENIAWGQKTPEQVMEGWMNSPGHRANILNASYTSIGVGYYRNAAGINYWSQLFTY